MIWFIAVSASLNRRWSPKSFFWRAEGRPLAIWGSWNPLFYRVVWRSTLRNHLFYRVWEFPKFQGALLTLLLRARGASVVPWKMLKYQGKTLLFEPWALQEEQKMRACFNHLFFDDFKKFSKRPLWGPGVNMCIWLGNLCVFFSTIHVHCRISVFSLKIEALNKPCR